MMLIFGRDMADVEVSRQGRVGENDGWVDIDRARKWSV